MIMPYKYPVNWDALILLYHELGVNLLNKTLKMAIFQPKMAPIGQNSQFFILIQYDYALQVSS